ncbi:cysteine desulfurase-like protein [Micromonospora echinofusca]|uniref:Cysteine desulfurase-like protein n=1 Tax=Micromonospora echinofusca TaxID=47858 RepID=A0ABS3VY33_MICEH|nr:cysteine desulfurase-like protein [Micromonospora echinofusca]MBO4209353.1 cysteine desulfurase-like protein [Micromonospora echinofusca]
MSLDVARIRAAYPALAEGLTHFDGAAGTQTAGTVAEAVAAAMTTSIANRTEANAPGRRSLRLLAEARAAIADLVGGDPDGVVLGPSATALTYQLAGLLSADWRPGDEVVVSRLDHDANVRPWVQAAGVAGATVRWAEFDPVTGELPVDQYADLVGERTRLVAVTGASNAIGTVPDVAAIARTAHAVGALVCVDGVHAVPHLPTDLAALGADFLVTSAYKWSGPHLAAMVADPARWAPLRPAKLMPAPDTVPQRFEAGTPAFPLLAGLRAAVDHLAGLAGDGTGSRRSRLRHSLAAAQAYEAELLDRLLTGFAARPQVTVYGAPQRRCPTVSFRIDGRHPAEVATALGGRGICVSSGDYYAYEYFTTMGLRDTGGGVRVSIYHYNTADEVDGLLDAVDGLIDGQHRG